MRWEKNGDIGSSGVCRHPRPASEYVSFRELGWLVEEFGSSLRSALVGGEKRVSVEIWAPGWRAGLIRIPKKAEDVRRNDWVRPLAVFYNL